MEIGNKDYNVLVDLLRPPEVEIRIHNRVFKELDGLKNVEGKSLQARRVSKFIEEALSKYRDRVQISEFGIKKPAEKFSSALQSEVDAIVLTLAELSKKEGEVELLSTDRNQTLIGKSLNINSFFVYINNDNDNKRTVSTFKKQGYRQYRYPDDTQKSRIKEWVDEWLARDETAKKYIVYFGILLSLLLFLAIGHFNETLAFPFFIIFIILASYAEFRFGKSKQKRRMQYRDVFEDDINDDPSYSFLVGNKYHSSCDDF